MAGRKKLSEKDSITTALETAGLHVIQGNKSYRITKANFQQSLTSGFAGSLAIADTPTVDGIYIAEETGTYTNAGSLIVDLSDTLTFIVVGSTQTTFDKIEIPLSSMGYESVGGLSSLDTLIAGGVGGHWVVTSDFTLDANKTLPSGTTLYFRGGIISGAFTITGTDSKISAEPYQIFDDAVLLGGTWDVNEFYPQWFGATGDGVTDDTDAFSALKNSTLINTVFIPEGSYLISSQIAWTQEINLIGDNKRATLLSTGSNVSMFDFSAKTKIEGLSFSSEGQTDTFITGTSITGGITIRNNSFDWANGSGVNGSTTGYGIDLVTTSDVLVEGNSFANSWRDKIYDATGWDTDGSNTRRDFTIQNNATTNKTVSILNNTFYDSCTPIHCGNCTDLIIDGNRIELTGDTAIFDRCTAGFSENKIITNNILKDIGKGAIKTLDTNNDTGNGGNRSVVSGNIIENWGTKLTTAAIFASNGYDGAIYAYDATNRNNDLVISNNTLIETSTDSCHASFDAFNVDNVLITGNTITLMDDTTDVDAIMGYSRFVFTNNIYKANGTISFGYAMLRGIVSNNSFEIFDNVKIDGDVAASPEPNRFLFTFTGNIVKTSDTDVTSARKAYGIEVTTNNDYGTYHIDGNTFETAIARVDSDQTSGVGIARLTASSDSYHIDNNLVIFTDSVDTQKTIGGTLLHPLYYNANNGSAVIDGTTGVITYKKGTGSAFRTDTETITPD